MSLFIVEIDPREKSIKKVEFNNESVELSDLYSSLECDMVERVSLNSNTDLWLDEEGGLNNSSERIGFFNIGEYQFIGKGMICNFTEDGDSVPMVEEYADFVIENLNVTF